MLMLAACRDGATVAEDAAVPNPDAFTAPYVGFVAVGEHYAEGRITATGACQCPSEWMPTAIGECKLVTDYADGCACPQCVDRLVVHAPGNPPESWPWAGLGEAIGMLFYASYDAELDESLVVDVEGCHGTLTIERTIPTLPGVVVGEPDLAGDTATITWETDRKADQVSVSVGTGAAGVWCLTEDTGSLAVSLPYAEIRSVFVERRFRVGAHQSEHAQIVYFESSRGEWRPTVDDRK